MLVEGTMIITWLGAGAAVGSLLTYRLANGLVRAEKDQKLKAFKVENEALARTNMIYRERIEQLENALFSNEKFMEMAKEINYLRSSNFKLRSRLRDLECLVVAEKKRSSREKVEKLEKTVRDLRNRIENEAQPETQTLPVLSPVFSLELPVHNEVAAAQEPVAKEEVKEESKEKSKEEPLKMQKKWSAIIKARRIN